MKNSAFKQLVLANVRILYRDGTAFFWNLTIPVIIYSVLAGFSNKIKIEAFNYGDFLLPGVVAYVIMQGGIYSLTYWLVDLKSQGVIKRFLVTPLKMRDLIASVVAARLLVMFLQIALITLIGVLFFHTPFAGNILSIVLLVGLGGGIFLLLGLLISAAAGSYQSASPITAAIGLPLTVLGNIFIPLSIFPKPIQAFGNFLPITYLSNGLRQAYLYPFASGPILKDISVLLIWLIIISVLTLTVLHPKIKK